MKALADISSSFDHVSTREELEQVMNVMPNLDLSEGFETNLEVPPVPEVAASDDEQTSASDLAALTTLLMGRHERIN